MLTAADDPGCRTVTLQYEFSNSMSIVSAMIARVAPGTGERVSAAHTLSSGPCAA
jgi:hypothetical protein